MPGTEVVRDGEKERSIEEPMSHLKRCLRRMKRAANAMDSGSSSISEDARREQVYDEAAVTRRNK
jgi:hypothetical protein